MNWTALPFTNATSASLRTVSEKDFLDQFRYAMEILLQGDSLAQVAKNDYPFGKSSATNANTNNLIFHLRDQWKWEINSVKNTSLRQAIYRFGQYSQLVEGSTLPVAQRNAEYLFSFTNNQTSSCVASIYLVSAINDILTANSLPNISTSLPPASGKVPFTRKYGSSPTTAYGAASEGDIVGPWLYNEFWAMIEACTHMMLHVKEFPSTNPGTFGNTVERKVGSSGNADCATARSDMETDFDAYSWTSAGTTPSYAYYYINVYDNVAGGGHPYEWDCGAYRIKPSISGLDPSILAGAELWYYTSGGGVLDYFDFTGTGLAQYTLVKHETWGAGATSYTATNWIGGDENFFDAKTCANMSPDQGYVQQFNPIWVLIYEIPDP